MDEECKYNEQCVALTDHSVCGKGDICECGKKYIANEEKNKCLLRGNLFWELIFMVQNCDLCLLIFENIFLVDLGENCNEDLECEAENANCDEGKCKCRKGFQENENQCWKSK